MTEPKIEFFCYEKMSNFDEDDKELKELHERLKLKTDTDKYRTEHAVTYQPPESSGYTSLPVLRELWGMSLSDLVMAYVHSLRPSAIRITSGWETTDAYPWRVTINVDKNDIIENIDQEVAVGYGCGADISQCLAAVKKETTPQAVSGCIGHTSGLERVDFT